MGYGLFTSSGTFKPADYGLAPGDTIQIAAIGGGAGGAGATTLVQPVVQVEILPRVLIAATDN